jgi:hypothetical protein
LAEGIKLRPEFNSLAQLRAYTIGGNPPIQALRDKTLDLGLRRAGMPEEQLFLIGTGRIIVAVGVDLLFAIAS